MYSASVMYAHRPTLIQSLTTHGRPTSHADHPHEQIISLPPSPRVCVCVYVSVFHSVYMLMFLFFTFLFYFFRLYPLSAQELTIYITFAEGQKNIILL